MCRRSQAQGPAPGNCIGVYCTLVVSPCFFAVPLACPFGLVCQVVQTTLEPVFGARIVSECPFQTTHHSFLTITCYCILASGRDAGAEESGGGGRYGSVHPAAFFLSPRCSRCPHPCHTIEYINIPLPNRTASQQEPEFSLSRAAEKGTDQVASGYSSSSMAYQEYVQKAIATGKSYDELPVKVKGAVSLPEWKQRCEGATPVRETHTSRALGSCQAPWSLPANGARQQVWQSLLPWPLSCAPSPSRLAVCLSTVCVTGVSSFRRSAQQPQKGVSPLKP